MKILGWALLVCLGLAPTPGVVAEVGIPVAHEEEETERHAERHAAAKAKRKEDPPRRLPPATPEAPLPEASPVDSPQPPPKVEAWTARLHQRSPSA